MDFLNCWNFHHGKDILLSPESIIEKDAPKMVKLWREEKCKAALQDDSAS